MFDDLFKEFNLNAAEKQLIDFSKTPITADISQIKIVSDLYNLKKAEKLVSNLIKSNEKLSASNNKYSLALNILTGVLVLVGIIQLITNFYN